jgi:hypothetical protein
MKTHAPKVITLVSSLMVAAGLTLAPLAAHAEDAPVLKGTFSTAFASRYVWRGQTLSKGFVAQPTVAITIGGFNANIWSNVDLDNSEADDDGIVLNETDITLNYTVPIGKVSLTGGFIHYDFDGVTGATPADTTTGSDTQEIYLTAAVATILNPTLSLYYDIDNGKGAFAVLAVSQVIPVGPISLTAGGSIGFNISDKAMGLNADGKDFTGLYYGEVSVSTSIPIFGKVSLDPRIAYSTALGSHGEHAIKSISVAGEKDIFYGSIAVTAAF